MATGLNDKLKFGKYIDKTPKEIIDSGDSQYFDYLFANTTRKFSAEVWRYIEEANKKPIKVGVIVGRFQTPFLHDGHLSLIKRVLDRCDKVIIVFGTTADLGTDEKNPFSYEFRKELLKYQLQNYSDKIIYNYILDCDDDSYWNTKLGMIVQNKIVALKEPIVTMYGSRDSFLKTYEGPFLKEELEVTCEMSATEIRQKYLKILLE